MISDPNDNPIILYACVAEGPTVLAEISSSSSAAADLAARCLAAAPRFHRLYSHTAGGRIYAFLMEDLLIFFAIADESLGKPQAILFLRRLRDAFFASSSIAIGGAAGDRPSPLCFQGEFLPELRRLSLPLSFEADKPPTPPLADPLPPAASGSESEKETPKETKRKKKKGLRERAREKNLNLSCCSEDREREEEIERERETARKRA